MYALPIFRYKIIGKVKKYASNENTYNMMNRNTLAEIDLLDQGQFAVPVLPRVFLGFVEKFPLLRWSVCYN